MARIVTACVCPPKGMKPIEAHLKRSATLPKYDITIKPRMTEPQVN